ncbi:uncharacterized protein LOC106394532 isoform X1 [Brassica napus]|uniref:uncharacterized protein LOC106394532 isoform X1 n=1 Tax=Brassica napus TaxID=3708 RepID=UPI0006AAD1A1|nr:uncharacterized protein LOC106394532 isoform X1 [Brassica napus]
MPSGAKKRKALKKKKELEAFGACPSNKGINDHGYDEHGSQDEGESDGNLSSSCSQGNGEFWTRDPSPSPLSGLGKSTVKEKTEDANAPQGQEAIDEGFTALGRGTGQEENGVDKSKQVEISDSVQHKSDESEEKHRPEEAKEGSIPVSEVPETSKDVKSVKESEVPECSQEKALEDNYRQVLAKTYLATVDIPSTVSETLFAHRTAYGSND